MTSLVADAPFNFDKALKELLRHAADGKGTRKEDSFARVGAFLYVENEGLKARLAAMAKEIAEGNETTIKLVRHCTDEIERLKKMLNRKDVQFEQMKKQLATAIKLARGAERKATAALVKRAV